MEPERQFRSIYDINPDETYSVRDAARYLGVHRCTVYAYIDNAERSLPFHVCPLTAHKLFRGADLIAYKAAGLPKKGRKRIRWRGR